METRNPDLTKKLISALAAGNFLDIQKAHDEGARFNHIPIDEHPFREFDTRKRMGFFEMVSTLFSAAMRHELFSWLIQRSRELPTPDADLCIPEPHLRAMNNQGWDSDSQLRDRFGRRPVSYYFAYGYLHDPDYITKLKSIRFDVSLIKDGFGGKAQLIPGFEIYLENCTDHDIDLNATQRFVEDSLARCLLVNEAYDAFLNLVKIQLRKDEQQGRRIIDVNHIYSNKTIERDGRTVYEKYVFVDKWLDFIDYQRLPLHEEVFSYFKLIDLYLCGRSGHYNILNQAVYANRVEWIDLLLSHCTGVNFNVKAMKTAPDGKSVVADMYSIAAWLVKNGQASVLAKHLDKATVPIDLSTPFSPATSRNLRDVIRMNGNPEGLLEKIGTLNVLRFTSSLPVLSRPAPSAAIMREPRHETQLACASSSSSSSSADDSSRKRALRKKKKPVVKHSTVDTVPANKTVEPDQPPSVKNEEIKRSLEGAFSFISKVAISHEDDKFIITFPETWTVTGPDKGDNSITFAPDDMADIINRIRKILARHCMVNEGKRSNQLALAAKDIIFNNDFNASMDRLHKRIYNLLQNADEKNKDEPSPPCATASSSPEPRKAAAELPDMFRCIAGLQSSFYFLLNGRTVNDGKDYVIEFCHERADSYDELLGILFTIADVINARLGDAMRITHERPKMKITIRTSALEAIMRLRSDLARLARDYDIRKAVPADPVNGSNTSDHTYRSARFQLCGANGQVLQTFRGFTWNLLNRCVEWNNPWKRTETINQYLDRKEKQLDKIMRLIEKNKPDFFFMQEVDIFSVLPPDFITREYATRHAEIKRWFYDFVRDRMSIRRQEYVHGIKRKPLVTLYNPGRLDFFSENTQFGGAGFECVFKVKAANTHLALINLHLYYDENANEEIAVYLKKLAAMGREAFIGGDNNSAEHPDIHVNPVCVTNVAATTVYQNRKPVCMITDKDEKGRSKAYDGFGAAVGPDHRVIIIEEEGEVFLFDERSQEYKVAAINPQARYPSSCTHEIRPQSSQQTTRGVQFHQSSQQKPPTDTPSAPQYTYKK